MPDEMDRATERSEAHRETCLGAVIRQLQQEGTPDCEICGEPIPARRREANPAARTCVPCQSQIEVRRGR